MLTFRLLLAVYLSIFVAPLATTEASEVEIYTSIEPPLTFENEQGRLEGFTLDYVNEIKSRMSIKTPTTAVPWARAYEEARHKPDIVLFSVTRTPQRENTFHWIANINQNAWGFFVSTKDLIKTAGKKELNQYKGIGVIRGTAYEKKLAEKRLTNIVPVSELHQLVNMLMLQRIDMIFYSYAGIAIYAKEQGIPFGCFYSVHQYLPEPAYIVMSKTSSSARVQQWRNVASDVKNDGTFRKIAESWVRRLSDDYGMPAHIQDNQLNLYAKDLPVKHPALSSFETEPCLIEK